MTELAQTVYSHLFTPNVDMCYLKLTIIESPHFYQYMNASDAHQPRLFSVYVDVHKEFKPGMFFASAQYGQFFIEYFRSMDDPQYVLANRCPKFHFLSIVCDGGTLHPDHLPCPSGGVDADAHEQWMDFLAHVRKFYDGARGIPSEDFFYGMYKELPAGGTVTQVLVASIPKAERLTFLENWQYLRTFDYYTPTGGSS